MTESTPFQELTKARLFIGIQQPQKALDALDNVTNNLFEEPDYWLLRGTAYLLLDRYAEAKKAILQGLVHDANNANLHHALAICYLDEKDLAAAERAILKALNQYPENPDFLTTYARALVAGKQLDKAKRMTAEGQRIDPENLRLKRLEAYIAYIEGDEEKARRISEEALSMNPDDVHNHHFLGALHLETGNLRQANVHLSRGARQAPENQDIVNTARRGKLMNHPLLWPLWPVQKWGSGKLWIGAMALAYGLRLSGQIEWAGLVAITYIVWALYTWIVPRLLVWWYERKYKKFQ